MIYHSSDSEEVLSYFQVDAEKGLPTGVADQRFVDYGENLLEKTKKTPLSASIAAQLKNPINVILIISVIISLIVNLIYLKENWYSPILIIIMLAINIAVTVFYQKQSENTADSLYSMNIPRVKVLRDGIVKTISSRYIVPGDILVLETGDYISADARLIETVDFRCNESFVTGEEITAEKDCSLIFEDITPIESRSNMVFSGSNVITGHAKAVVTETGMNTEVGKAVTLFETHNSVNIKLKEKLTSIGHISTVVLILFCIVAFFANVIINFRAEQEFALTLANSLINSLVLLVSVLPEGLPVMAAVALGVSIKVLLGSGMITKDFEVFDMLPEVSVICSDKTGTLTQDNMRTEKIFNGRNIIDADMAFEDKSCVSILRLASLCTSQYKDDADSSMYKDATELAIIRTYEQSVIPEESDIHNNYPLLCKLPFDNERKITVTVNMIDGIPYAIVKGAPDHLLTACGCQDNELTIKTVNDFAASGMRVIAVAFRQLSEIPSNLELSDFDGDLTFAGLIALSDPPQENSIALVEQCDKGGIRTIMITGDHPTTARAVARRLGILKDGTEIITGEKLAEMTDEELIENIHKFSVFARLLPDQKLRIVSALKACGMTVAITGDSVNDAHALKNAHVGIAMGNRGTDVARGAADIIMNNNSFSSIITAINTARGLFCSIRKALVYLLSSNIGELLSILICLFAFGCFPITAVQLLLVNLITDSLPVISILSDGIYEHKPMHTFTASDKAVFTAKSAITTSIQAVMTAAAAIIAYGMSAANGQAFASTMMFTVLIATQLLNMVTTKFETLFISYRHFRNIPLSAILSVLILVAVLLVLTPMGVPFGMTALKFVDFIKALLLSLTVFITGELTKIGFKLYDKFSDNK